MINLLDIAERIQKGPKMEEKDWDLSLFNKMNELTRKYGIQCPDRGSFINTDDHLLERAFQAAVEFLAHVGMYCISTQRVVQFSEEEVCRAVREAPREVSVGEGRDLRVIRQKEVEGSEPLNHCPGHHSPFTEGLGPLLVKNLAQIPSADFVEGFNFSEVDNREIFGLPLEAYASRRQIAWLRDGVRKAGRPGMAVALYPISTRAAALIAPIDPDYGLRRTDGVLLSLLPDVKLEQDMLTAAIIYEDYGSFKVNVGGHVAVGGFCGGPEGALIEAIVRSIGGWLVYHDVLCVTGVTPMVRANVQKIKILPVLRWASAVVFQAVNRFTNLIVFGLGGGASGPGTRSHLWELALGVIHGTINGANLYVPRQSRAMMNAGQTPLEAEWMAEVSGAVIRAGLNRQEGEELLRKVAQKLDDGPVEDGLDIRECYDLVHHRPLANYEKIYLQVKKELAQLGLPLNE